MEVVVREAGQLAVVEGVDDGEDELNHADRVQHGRHQQRRARQRAG